MKSVMQHTFSMIPKAQIPRSQFNRSHGLKTTFDAGYLVPIYCDEALPGDTFNLKLTSFARLATPAVPIMDNLYLDTFFFAIPIRLIWDNWQKMNGEQTDPGDSIVFSTPLTGGALGTGFTEGSLGDYLGIPTKIPVAVCAFWHRAYNLVWNQWFRDENLQDSAVVDKDDGPDTDADYFLRKRGKRHDYFTSCLPWPEKDNKAVTIPLGTTAPVVSDETQPSFAILGAPANSYNLGIHTAASSTLYASGIPNTGDQAGMFGNNSGLEVDLSTATAATINSLRQAFQIQRLYERDARGGTRYTEIIRSHFGVISPDARLQRPEYLGGGSSPINIHPIAQTSETNTTPQGNLAAIGVHSQHGQGFVKSFTEHCVLLGLASVRADLNYQQGLNRMFSRRTRWDFYWPALAHLGEQAVLNKEIYLDVAGAGTNDLAFGYQERWAEYKYKPSIVTGKFRSNCTTPLDFWHLSQDFGALPVLDATFIEENPPLNRILAVSGEPQILMDCFFDLKCARPMPTFSVPGLIDHF